MLLCACVVCGFVYCCALLRVVVCLWCDVYVFVCGCVCVGVLVIVVCVFCACLCLCGLHDVFLLVCFGLCCV